MTESVRLIDLVERHRAVAEDVERRVIEVLRSGRYVGGPVVAEAERVTARALGRRRGVGVANGTDALMLALMSVGVGPGDEVVVPAVTFFATAGAVVRLGAVPVVVDVLPDRPLMDPAAAAAVCGTRTRALVPVHLFGAMAEVPAVDVPVVDDAAQAMGGTPPRSIGVATTVSFYPTKVLGIAGDGGMVVSDDDAVADTVRALGNHGAVGPHHHQTFGGHTGFNSRLDAVQAAVLCAHVQELGARVSRRQVIAAAYDSVFGQRAVPRDPGSPVSIYAIRHPERDRVAQALQAAGIETAVYYPRPLGAQPALADIARLTPTPHATAFCRETLALPCREGMGDAEVERVLDAIREWL